jgi:hypothetical protein
MGPYPSLPEPYTVRLHILFDQVVEKQGVENHHEQL